MTRPAIPLLAFAAFLVIGLALVLSAPYPSNFDELEHVSYVAWLQEHPTWRPAFEVMQTLRRDSLAVWDRRANYLGHPAPFYGFETLLLDRTLPLHDGVTRLRLGSAALVMAGVAATLWAGMRSFAADRLALLVFAALVTLAPKLLAVTQQVSNDALALLAGGLAYCAIQRRTAVLAGVALMLACWAKPNAGLAVGAALGIAALLQRDGRLLLALLVGGAVGIIPTVPILLKYGALVPITVEQFGQVQSIPGLSAFGPVFLATVATTFGYAQGGTWPLAGAGQAAMIAVVWALLAAMGAGAVTAGQGREPGRVAAMAGPLALLAVMPIHFWFSATTLGGSLPAASFRYYLPIWPFLAHALAFGIRGGSGLRRILFALLAGAALTLGWLSP